MTNFRKTRYFEEHLQSYFVTFKQSVLKDKSFREFWSQVEDFTDVQDVIDHYETQFTKRFVEAGFKYQALLDTRQEEAGELVHPDFSYYKPLRILEAKIPFLKVKALTGNPFWLGICWKILKPTHPIQLRLLGNTCSIILVQTFLVCCRTSICLRQLRTIGQISLSSCIFM